MYEISDREAIKYLLLLRGSINRLYKNVRGSEKIEQSIDVALNALLERIDNNTLDIEDGKN